MREATTTVVGKSKDRVDSRYILEEGETGLSDQIRGERTHLLEKGEEVEMTGGF